MAKTLAEVKTILKTEMVFETETSFLVNDFGKYRPNITFVISKEFEGDPLAFRHEGPVGEMLADMNISFGGGTEVFFGDFWISKKGGACFRPKGVAEAQHLLIRCGWGGAFSRTRGIGDAGTGVIYSRRAGSNGGGMGYDYLVVPVGFYRSLHDAEIDGDAAAAAPNFAERAKTIREQFAEYDREQAEKAEAVAKAKAEAEEASRAAKLGELGVRLEAVNVRLEAMGEKPILLEETTFTGFWSYKYLYTPQNVANIERKLEEAEREFRKKAEKRLARAAFQLKFEAFKPRFEALGLAVEYSDDGAHFSGDYYGKKPYSEEGLAKFVAELDKRERDAAEARAKAQAEATYQTRKTEAAALGLPTDIRIWCRRGGRTNAGDGWVIGADGQDRGNTAWYNPRPRHAFEGDKIWEQILQGEVVLKWSKGSSAAAHEFEVIHLPTKGLTDAQLERIAEIQDELEREWEGARGMASGLPSPPVGKGWGLLTKEQPTPRTVSLAEGGERASATQLDALRTRYGK